MSEYGAASTPSATQTDEKKKLAQSYVDRHAALKSKRSNWESHWSQCMKYIVPRKDDVVSDRQPGDRRNDDLFDTTAIMSNQLLAAALHGMLTNPAMRFFELTMNDAKLDEDEEVKAWLEQSSDRMFVVMNNSNFQTEVHEIYIDEGAIGTACMFTGEHDERVVHFNARSMKEIFVDENNLGLIDTVHREFKWKLKQIVQEFGEKVLTPELLKRYRDGNSDDLVILHCVHPMDAKDPDSKGGVYKFKSVYILKEELLFLSTSGFREFPYAVPRWTKTSGEIYGRGPGMEMLPDIKMVNAMMETTLQGAALTVFPPVAVEDDSVLGRVKMTPGGVTITRPGIEQPIKPWMTDARIDFGYQAVEDVRKRIRSGFYVDQLQLNEGPQMTATEVSQRTEEKLRLMGPVLGRQHFEFLRPVIERVFAIMSRKGLIEPAPKKIQGKKWDVRYSSLAARAQRASDGQNLNRAIQVAAPIINAKPEAMDIISADKAVRYVFDIYGVPVKLFNSDRDIKQIRDAREKAQEAAAKQAQEQHQADIASKTMPGMAQLQQAQAQGQNQ